MDVPFTLRILLAGILGKLWGFPERWWSCYDERIKPAEAVGGSLHACRPLHALLRSHRAQD